MSKDEKYLHIKSATEIKQTPITNDIQSKSNKRKSKPSVKKAKHKHDYQIINIDKSFISGKLGDEPFTNPNHNSEYFGIDYKCSICGKDKRDWLSISIDEWNEKYKDIYNKLNLGGM